MSTAIPDIDAIIAGQATTETINRAIGAARSLTDMGNAERLVDMFGDVLRYDHSAGRWLYWDGRRWAVDAKGRVLHLGRIVVRRIYAEASAADTERDRKAIADHAKASESLTRIRAMVELAKSDPVVACTTNEFDTGHDILNTESGIIDLRSGDLRPHDPTAMCSKIAPVAFDPDLLESDDEAMPMYATMGPTFAAFIAEIALGRRDFVVYLQRLIGYGATGYANEQILPIAVGVGQNGKGTLLRAVKHVLGDYAQSAPPSLITDTGKAGSGASPEIARLHGVRLLEIEETQDGDKLHEARVKWLTGEDTLVGRHLFHEFVEFEPTFTPVLVTNHKPRVNTGGLAVWRRLRVLPFDYVAPHADKLLAARLEAEAESILAWIIEGARGWFAEGMPASETVETASSAYKGEQDKVAPFLEDCTHPYGEVHRSRLFKAYQKWCESEGEHAMTARSFNEALRERGYEEVKQRTYGEITLKGGWE